MCSKKERPKNTQTYPRIAKVLIFDENLGRGIIQFLDTGERIRINHKQIDDNGFKILFEGELVEVHKTETGKLVIRRIENEQQ